MTRLIGLTGFKRAGKDSTCTALTNVNPGLSVRRVSFADKIKKYGALALGIDHDEIKLMDEAKESWEFEIYDGSARSCRKLTGREYLQNLGASGRDLFGASFWIDPVVPPSRSEFNVKYNDADIVCVTDVRYENEAFRILNIGGEVWRIERPGTESDGHSSEQPLRPEFITVTIQNDGTLEDLAGKVPSE